MTRRYPTRRQEVFAHGVIRAKGQGQGEAAAAREVTPRSSPAHRERRNGGPMAKSAKKVRVRVKKPRIRK
jgi:hypothetical protein